MQIGDVTATGIARLAPMAAISNAPFRIVALECGSAFTTTEELDATSIVRRVPTAMDLARSYPQERPLAMQLLGCDPDTLCEAAEWLQEQGADIIDLNMGCPVPKITKQGKGSALMRDVPAAARLLTAMRRVIQVPFTIKIRGGWDDSHLNAVEVARMAEDVGVDAITVHPRTRSQQFTGKAPWQIIADVVQAVSIPVTGNGDVKSMADARAMMAETGCDHVMIGRGAVGSPWVFNEAFDSWSAREQWAYRERTIRRHVELMRAHYADTDARVGHTQMRKQLAWYSEGLPHSAGFRQRIFMTKTMDEAEATFWELWEHASQLFAGGDWQPSRKRELVTV